MHLSAQLACPSCDWQCYCGASDMLRWLKRAGMVRRDTAPEPELLPELFRAAAGKFACPECRREGLNVGEAEENDDEAWGMARKCSECGQPIARERLEVFPDTTVCVACQGKLDRGESTDAPEYCSRCGNVMTLKQSGRGVTRYAMVCPSCRR
ncbi:MAG: hypothetical protein DWQ37_01495 [Planctomycetota bacterium]|nr:MAG: hypothetical protein DWQ37_01495 [Planctomycetota bacterium]